GQDELTGYQASGLTVFAVRRPRVGPQDLAVAEDEVELVAGEGPDGREFGLVRVLGGDVIGDAHLGRKHGDVEEFHAESRVGLPVGQADFVSAQGGRQADGADERVRV